ncbi:hypothetical protein BDQ17DRAFT_1333833 [Cyathus striatus]|nr:hypothetical protein BDQ17DRAFT_1333833 [Cyathus striatus]
MHGLLYILQLVLIFTTPFNEVKKATEDLSQVKAFVKKFSAQRAMCLVIMQVKIIGPQLYTLINVLPGIILQVILLYEIFTMSSSVALSIVISFSCFVLGIASLVAAGVMGEELMPLPVVAAGVTSG